MRVRHLAAGLLWLLAACSVTPPTAPDAIPVDPGTPPVDDGVPADSQAGTFRGLSGHAASGHVTVVFDNGTATITLGSDVRFTNVPGPVLYLNTTDNANMGTPLRIANLTSRTGPATFTVRVDPSVRYTRVLIWCDPFNVGVGAATIAPAPTTPPPPSATRGAPPR